MFVKQITMFIENRAGRISEFTALLAKNNIDLIAISIADTANFGILRAIVNDPDKASELLLHNEYTVNLTDVLAVAVPDSPGGLASVTEALRQADISIEYLYSLVRRVGHQAIIILRVNKAKEAENLFVEKGIKMLAHEDILL